MPRSEIVFPPGARCPWRADELWPVLGAPIGWAEANRLMCDLIHRGRLPSRVDAPVSPRAIDPRPRDHEEEEDVT
jgi:hypothetical protein